MRTVSAWALALLAAPARASPLPRVPSSLAEPDEAWPPRPIDDLPGHSPGAEHVYIPPWDRRTLPSGVPPTNTDSGPACDERNLKILSASGEAVWSGQWGSQLEILSDALLTLAWRSCGVPKIQIDLCARPCSEPCIPLLPCSHNELNATVRLPTFEDHTPADIRVSSCGGGPPVGDCGPGGGVRHSAPLTRARAHSITACAPHCPPSTIIPAPPLRSFLHRTSP